MEVRSVIATTFSFILNPFSFQTGGGVWESNPPRHALAHPLTVLKTAPITGQDAPPNLFVICWRVGSPHVSKGSLVLTSVASLIEILQCLPIYYACLKQTNRSLPNCRRRFAILSATSCHSTHWPESATDQSQELPSIFSNQFLNFEQTIWSLMAIFFCFELKVCGRN